MGEVGLHLPVMGQPGQLEGRCCETCGKAGDDRRYHYSDWIEMALNTPAAQPEQTEPTAGGSSNG